jgi:hypothetical protein
MPELNTATDTPQAPTPLLSDAAESLALAGRAKTEGWKETPTPRDVRQYVTDVMNLTRTILGDISTLLGSSGDFPAEIALNGAPSLEGWKAPTSDSNRVATSVVVPLRIEGMPVSLIIAEEWSIDAYTAKPDRAATIKDDSLPGTILVFGITQSDGSTQVWPTFQRGEELQVLGKFAEHNQAKGQ